MTEADIEQSLEYIANALKLFPKWAARGNIVRDHTVDSIGNYGRMVSDLVRPPEPPVQDTVQQAPVAPPTAGGTVIHFATRTSKGRNVTIEEGFPFPNQSRESIRLLAGTFGIPDGQKKRLSELPYVESLLIADERFAEQVIKERIHIAAVKKVLEEDGERHVA